MPLDTPAPAALATVLPSRAMPAAKATR